MINYQIISITITFSIILYMSHIYTSEFAMQIHMIQVLIKIKGIFKNFSKFILTKKRNIYYMFHYLIPRN